MLFDANTHMCSCCRLAVSPRRETSGRKSKVKNGPKKLIVARAKRETPNTRDKPGPAGQPDEPTTKPEPTGQPDEPPTKNKNKPNHRAASQPEPPEPRKKAQLRTRNTKDQQNTAEKMSHAAHRRERRQAVGIFHNTNQNGCTMYVPVQMERRHSSNPLILPSSSSCARVQGT